MMPFTSDKKVILIISLVIFFIAFLGMGWYLFSRLEELPQKQPQLNIIELSLDKRSILNSQTKEVIFTIEDTKRYLNDFSYAYNPETFQTTNAKYAGDCFSDAALSNSKQQIVFSTSCLLGDLSQPWIGIYDIPDVCAPTEYSGGECHKLEKIRFLISGSGRDFVWSDDDKTITYEADLGLSGMTEMRTVDSQTGEIKERISDIKVGAGESKDINIETMQKSVDEGHQPWRLNPDMVLLSGVKLYGFTDEDINNIDLEGVLNEPGKKVYKIQHKTDFYLVAVSQPIIGKNKIWIISEIKLDETADWILVRDEKEGYEFKYPRDFDFGGGLPPEVKVDYNFRESEGGKPIIEEKDLTINNIRYHLSMSEEGAAGSTLEEYFYETSNNGKSFTIHFLVKFATDCQTYAQPGDQVKCENFKAAFEKMIEKVVTTFKFIEKDETADWKTYRNEEYGFEVKYPAGWLSSGEIILSTRREIQFYENKNIIISVIVGAPYSQDLGRTFTLEEWIAENKKANQLNVAEGKIILDDIEASELSYDGMGVFFRKIYFQKEGMMYEIEISYSSEETAKNIYKPLSDQILSTFRFIEGKILRDNEFELSKIEVGDKIEGMSIKIIKPFMEGYLPFGADNVSIQFSGEATVEGNYNYFGDEEGFFNDLVCFTLDEDSQGKIPKMVGDDRETWFCFGNQDLAKNNFAPKGSSGTATVVIDDYTINYYPSEVWDTAKLVKVISRE